MTSDDAVSDAVEAAGLLVAVTGAPGIDMLLRRAARMAARTKGELDVLHVATGDATRSGDEGAITALQELADDLGARWRELPADDPARAMSGFARDHHITQIVIGSSQRSPWQELIRGGSIVRRIIREAGQVGIDVHVMTRRALPAGEATEEGDTRG